MHGPFSPNLKSSGAPHGQDVGGTHLAEALESRQDLRLTYRAEAFGMLVSRACRT